jgi:hypothetical protein
MPKKKKTSDEIKKRIEHDNNLMRKFAYNPPPKDQDFTPEYTPAPPSKTNDSNDKK